MDFQDPVIKAEVDAILMNKDIWTNDREYMPAWFALIGNLYKRGYSREEILQVAMYVSNKRCERLDEYRRELERLNK